MQENKTIEKSAGSHDACPEASAASGKTKNRDGYPRDVKQESHDGHRYWLAAVNRASKFQLAYTHCPLPSKDAVGASRRRSEILLTFGVRHYRSGAMLGERSPCRSVTYLCCQWLRVSIGYDSTNYPRAQGGAESMEGWFQEVLSELCKSWRRVWDRYSPRAGSNASHPELFSLSFGAPLSIRSDAGEEFTVQVW